MTKTKPGLKYGRRPTKDEVKSVSPLIHNPLDVNRAGLADLKEQQKNPFHALPMMIPSIDKHYVPLRPKQVEYWLGRPGHGKTAVLINRCRKRSQALFEAGVRRASVFVTVEQSVEEVWRYGISSVTNIPLEQISRAQIAGEELREVEQGVLTSSIFPMWILGISTENAGQKLKFTLPNIVDALFDIERVWGIKVDSVFLDYLQLLESTGRPRSMVEQVGGHCKEIKQAAKHTNASWVVAAQAKGQVDDRADPMPKQWDGAWAQEIGHTGDSIWGAVRPSKYGQEGDDVGGLIVKGKQQFVVNLDKHKYCEPNQRWVLNLNPALNELSELEMKYATSDGEKVSRKRSNKPRRISKAELAVP